MHGVSQAIAGGDPVARIREKFDVQTLFFCNGDVVLVFF